MSLSSTAAHHRGRLVISFVWSPGQRLPAGTGGSENYTVGHVRELVRRGVPARVITVGVGTTDGRGDFDGVPFTSVAGLGDLQELDDTLVFVNETPAWFTTRHPSFQLLHVPPPLRADQQLAIRETTRDRTLIATSRYAAGLWADFLDVDRETVHVVHPFADAAFSEAVRPPRADDVHRVLFAGRLTSEKGVYTLLSMLHTDLFGVVDQREHSRGVRLAVKDGSPVAASGPSVSLTMTTAGSDKPQGAIIERLLRAHPAVSLTAARRSPAAMARLMAEHDVVVMPSNGQYWHETFGIVSIEAQHAGCRVVASHDGGLPETDCGSLVLVAPDDAEALAQGVLAACRLGAVGTVARARAAAHFGVRRSVDDLLAVLDLPHAPTPAAVIRDLEAIAALPVVDPTPARPRLDDDAVLAGTRERPGPSRPRSRPWPGQAHARAVATSAVPGPPVRVRTPRSAPPQPTRTSSHPAEDQMNLGRTDPPRHHDDGAGDTDDLGRPRSSTAAVAAAMNAADREYLRRTHDALVVARGVSAAVVRNTASPYRALAREALSAQSLQLDAVTARLASGTTTRRPADAPAPAPHAVPTAFPARLAAHARAAIVDARAEMIGGLDQGVRGLAQDAIAAHSHQLGLLGRMDRLASVARPDRSD